MAARFFTHGLTARFPLLVVSSCGPMIRSKQHAGRLVQNRPASLYLVVTFV